MQSFLRPAIFFFKYIVHTLQSFKRYKQHHVSLERDIHGSPLL